jgi:hypothetical protein
VKRGVARKLLDDYVVSCSAGILYRSKAPCGSYTVVYGEGGGADLNLVGIAMRAEA